MKNDTKKNIKIIIGAMAVTGIILGTPIEDKIVRSKTVDFPDKSISMYDENGNQLSTLMFVDENGKAVKQEKYGYINLDKNGFTFEDALTGEQLQLYKDNLSTYDVYYSEEVISNYIDASNDSISYNELKNLEEEIFAAKEFGNYHIYYSNIFNDFVVEDVKDYEKKHMYVYNNMHHDEIHADKAKVKKLGTKPNSNK